jgi:hypothetical protein
VSIGPICSEVWTVDCSMDYGEMSHTYVCEHEECADVIISREESDNYMCYKMRRVLNPETGEFE